MFSKKAKISFVLLLLLELFLLNTSYTDADLFAERNVTQNKLTAVVLNFFSLNSATHAPLQTLFHSTNVKPNGFDVRSVRLQNEGSAEMKYSIKAEKTGGDDTLCNNLKIQLVSRDFTKIYEGPLLDVSGTSSIAKKASQDILFLVYLDSADDTVKGKLCEFSLKLRSYRKTPDERGGIYAERKLTNIISTSL